MTTVVLNVKIDAELKEKLRHYAEVNNENLGTATEKLLQLAFQLEASADEAGVTEEDIDSQHTEEEADAINPKSNQSIKKTSEEEKMKQQFSTASNYSEACDMLRSGYVKHVRLNWNIGSDEFFRIASDWCDTGAKIKKDEDGFIISLKGFPIPRQH